MKPLNIGSLRSSATTDADADADADTEAEAEAEALGTSDDAEPLTRSYMSDDEAYQSGYGGEELHGDEVVSVNSVDSVAEEEGRAPSYPSPALPPSPTPAMPRDGIPRIPQADDSADDSTNRRLSDSSSNRWVA